MTIETVLDNAIVDGSVPGAIAAVTAPGRDPVIYVGGDDGLAPLRRDTIMRIASISKPDITDGTADWAPGGAQIRRRVSPMCS